MKENKPYHNGFRRNGFYSYVVVLSIERYTFTIPPPIRLDTFAFTDHPEKNM